MHDLLAPGGLSTLFQPIFEVREGSPSLFALEALSRGRKNSPVERADALFETVRRTGMEVEVDRLCAGAAINAGSRFEGAASIFRSV